MGKRITQTPNHIPHVKNMTVLSITVIINYKPALQNSRTLKNVFVLRFLQPVFYVQKLGLALFYTEAVQILVHPEINIFRENEQQMWNSVYTTLTVEIMVGLQTAVLSDGKGSYGQETVKETCSQTLLSLYLSPSLKMNRSFQYLDDFCHSAHRVYAYVSYSQWNQGSIWLKLSLVLWSGVLMPAIWLKPRDRHYTLQKNIFQH